MSERVVITDFTLAESPIGGPVPEFGWLPAVVPGGVHESLLAAGRIEHPYRDRHETEVRWIEDRDWWYRATLRLPDDLDPGERLRLVCHGLDTVVDLWLDDTALGHHENMFRPAEFDLSAVAPGEHTLLLRFSPPLAGITAPPTTLDMLGRIADTFGELAPEPGDQSADGEPEEAGGLMSAALPLATRRRKATFSWGWDFGPRLPSIGIWLPVELVRERGAVITGHHLRTDQIDSAGTAELSLLVEVVDLAPESLPASGLRAVVTLTSARGARHQAVLKVTDGVGRGSLSVPDAELWWTHDLGDPALHEVVIELIRGEQTVDRVEDRIGLRTIALDRSPDPEGGRLFRFLLNGEPIFARGAAWLPPSMLVGSVDDRRLHDLVSLARDGEMTMLRIWGGGIYEHDAFYRACDELGVLVWQDFAFACIDYPSEDPVLAAEVALEAEFQVRRLRNHPSLALWCGNNEVQLVHGFAYQDHGPGNWGHAFFHELLPQTVHRLDGGVPYWPGSPWGEDETEGWMAVNGVRDGDRHAWEVWHGFDFGAGGGDFASVGEARHFRRYGSDRGKFISEFGIHASPELGTLERWVRPDTLDIHSAAFDAHNKDHPKNKHDAILEIVTGLPRTVSEYVDATMVSQAEGLKFGIEHYRRRQPHCSGALVWQFNDVWPGFSWSVVDHDLVPKAGYYAAKRAFSPLLASFRLDGDRLELWASNSARPVDTVLEVAVRGFDGTTVTSASVPVRLGLGESAAVWSVSGVAAPDRYARVGGGSVPANRLFFAEIKDIDFGPARLDWTTTPTGPGSARVVIRSSGYSFLVHLPSPAPGVRFSDNYLDLPDGAEVRIEVSGLPDGFVPQRLQVLSYRGPGAGDGGNARIGP